MGSSLVFGRIDEEDVEDATHPDRLEREGESLWLDIDAYDEAVPRR